MDFRVLPWVCPMELRNLVFSLECLVSNRRQALLGGIRLGGSATCNWLIYVSNFYTRDREPKDCLSTEYRRQSSEGYPTKVDSSVEIRVIENKKAIETHELDRFRPSV